MTARPRNPHAHPRKPAVPAALKPPPRRMPRDVPPAAQQHQVRKGLAVPPPRKGRGYGVQVEP